MGRYKLSKRRPKSHSLCSTYLLEQWASDISVVNGLSVSIDLILLGV